MLAFRVIRAVTADRAYANLALSEALSSAHLSPSDAGLCTELVAGTLRGQGTYDAIIERASGRALKTLQPAVVDVLRMAAHQLFLLETPAHATVSTSVDLARAAIGERVTGVVNAVVRRLAAKTLPEWLDELSAGLSERDAIALRTMHPCWIVDAWAEVLPPEELVAALEADNVAPQTCLAVRPGLLSSADLVAEAPDAVRPARYSPFGAWVSGNPGNLDAVRRGLAGVQDEGSQLVTWALTRVQLDDPTPATAPWLDLCAGPGGKSALLAGLAHDAQTWLLAGELQPHRARLIASALSAYPVGAASVVVADGTAPAWSAASFNRVLADVPCSGLGALRRRPDARWRKLGSDVTQLHPLQTQLLDTALDAATPGGVVAYVTCSPHRHETHDVVSTVLHRRRDAELLDAPSFLPEVPTTAALSDPRYVQLWPHRHGTDAMFLALLHKNQHPGGTFQHV